MNKTKKERNTRIKMKVFFNVISESDNITLLCSNISSDGAFIETSNPYSVGTNLTIQFTLPNNRVKIKLNSKVIWIERNTSEVLGMGIQFYGVANEEQMQLDRAVKYFTQLTDRIT